MLMIRAGFDPDFVPALHHLLEGQPGQSEGNIFDPSHPHWNEREQHLQKLYVAAGKEYDRLWPDRYASPGGNSPTVVYAGSPTAKRVSSGEMEVLIPLHCRNLVGSVVSSCASPLQTQKRPPSSGNSRAAPRTGR